MSIIVSFDNPNMKASIEGLYRLNCRKVINGFELLNGTHLILFRTHRKQLILMQCDKELMIRFGYRKFMLSERRFNEMVEGKQVTKIGRLVLGDE